MSNWQFAHLEAIENTVFNNALEKFYGLGVDGLVRENIQNSMDAKLIDNNDPVQVHIEIGEMFSGDIPGIDEIRNRICHLKGENNYSKGTIEHMKREQDKFVVPYISFEDSNTRGLTGAKHGQNFQANDTWGAYAYKKGVHPQEKDEEKESIRGGSHGIGKIASNAASDLHIMFFANCDENGDKHLGGTVQLIEHKYNGEFYRDTGYFAYERGNLLYPYENEFRGIFKKDTRGLKIIIPFLRKQNNDERSVVCSVCDNFFIAIMEKKLVVRVNDLIIDKDSIINIVNNDEYYKELDVENIKNNFTPLYINTYMNYKPVEIKIEDKEKKQYEFMLYLQYDRNIKKGRTAIVRRIGMKIEDKKIRNMATSPFNAVMIPVSDKEDRFLKSLENESHTSLSSQHIKDQDIQSNATRFINNISKEIGKYISDIMKRENPVDGAMDTSDILYSVESNFKKELQKDISTVQLTKRSKKSKRNIVKVKTHVKSNTHNSDDKSEKNHTVTKRRKPAKIQDGDGEDVTRVRFGAEPEEVKRLVLPEKEILHIDLSHNDQYDDECKCDLILHIIDGTGKEYTNECYVNNNYSRIMDMNTNLKCEVENNAIKNISICNKKIKLQLQTTPKCNNSLKFIYYVEV